MNNIMGFSPLMKQLDTLTDSNLCQKDFKSRISEILELTNNLITAKSQLIMRELQSLKSGVASNLQSLTDYAQGDLGQLNSPSKYSESSGGKLRIKRKETFDPVNYSPSAKNFKPTSPFRTDIKHHSAIGQIKLKGNSSTNNMPLVQKPKLPVKKDSSTFIPKMKLKPSHSPIIERKILNKNTIVGLISKNNPNFNGNKTMPVYRDSKDSNKNSNNLNGFPGVKNDNHIKKLSDIERPIVDGRKFSILDIPNFETVLNNYGKQLDQKTERERASHKYISAFYTLAKSRVLNFKERIFFCSYKRAVARYIKPEDILSDCLSTIQMRINLFENASSYQNLLNFKRKCTPSITAQSVLNLITQTDENIIEADMGIPEVANIVKIILILIHEEIRGHDIEDPTQYFKILRDVVYPRYKLNNLKNLFFKVLYKKVFMNDSISDEKVSEINRILKIIPKIIQPHEISNFNKPASYLSYSIKEICDFINIKRDNQQFNIQKKKLKLLKKLKKEEIVLINLQKK